MSSVSPVKLEKNRVWRIYLGGKLIDEFRSEEGSDGYFPEDWIASVVRANNPDRDGKPENEGLTREAGTCKYLKDLIEDNPLTFLGAQHIKKHGESFGVLTKFLDSAERLPIQVHPDKEAAKRLFNSEYGKTEAWYILGGRVINGEEPYILLGFKEEVSAEQLHELFDKQDITGMEALMHKVPVKAGDVYIIMGGTPHAIGPGCFLLEIQEPTDYTISLEKCNTLGEKLPDFLCHQGIGFDKMFECFHYKKHSYEELINEFKLKPQVIYEDVCRRVTSLISYSTTACFSLERTDIFESHVRTSKSERPCAIVAVAGEGKISGVKIRQGESMFIPAACSTISFEVEKGKTLSILECLPPC